MKDVEYIKTKREASLLSAVNTNLVILKILCGNEDQEKVPILSSCLSSVVFLSEQEHNDHLSI